MVIQQRIENYWSTRVSGYSQQIREELNSFKRDAWKKLISENAGFSVQFAKADVQNLPFANNTFDLIVCRNLVWTVTNPQDTYKE